MDLDFKKIFSLSRKKLFLLLFIILILAYINLSFLNDVSFEYVENVQILENMSINGYMQTHNTSFVNHFLLFFLIILVIYFHSCLIYEIYRKRYDFILLFFVFISYLLAEFLNALFKIGGPQYDSTYHLISFIMLYYSFVSLIILGLYFGFVVLIKRFRKEHS